MRKARITKNHSKPSHPVRAPRPEGRVGESRPRQQEEPEHGDDPVVVGPLEDVAEDPQHEQGQARRDQREEGDEATHQGKPYLPIGLGGCKQANSRHEGDGMREPGMARRWIGIGGARATAVGLGGARVLGRRPHPARLRGHQLPGHAARDRDDVSAHRRPLADRDPDRAAPDRGHVRPGLARAERRPGHARDRDRRRERTELPGGARRLVPALAGTDDPRPGLQLRRRRPPAQDRPPAGPKGPRGEPDQRPRGDPLRDRRPGGAHLAKGPGRGPRPGDGSLARRRLAPADGLGVRPLLPDGREPGRTAAGLKRGHAGVPLVREGQRPDDGLEPRQGRGRDRAPPVRRRRAAGGERRQPRQHVLGRRARAARRR